MGYGQTSNKQQFNPSAVGGQRLYIYADIANLKSEPTNVGYWHTAIKTIHTRCPDLVKDWKNLKPMIDELENLAGTCAHKGRMETAGYIMQSLGLTIRLKNFSLEAREHAKRLEQDSLAYYLPPQDVNRIAAYFCREARFGISGPKTGGHAQAVENFIRLESAIRLWLSNGRMDKAQATLHYLVLHVHDYSTDPQMSKHAKTPEFQVVVDDLHLLNAIIALEQMPANLDPMWLYLN